MQRFPKMKNVVAAERRDFDDGHICKTKKTSEFVVLLSVLLQQLRLKFWKQLGERDNITNAKWREESRILCPGSVSSLAAARTAQWIQLPFRQRKVIGTLDLQCVEIAPTVTVELTPALLLSGWWFFKASVFLIYPLLQPRERLGGGLEVGRHWTGCVTALRTPRWRADRGCRDSHLKINLAKAGWPLWQWV